MNDHVQNKTSASVLRFVTFKELYKMAWLSVGFTLILGLLAEWVPVEPTVANISLRVLNLVLLATGYFLILSLALVVAGGICTISDRLKKR